MSSTQYIKMFTFASFKGFKYIQMYVCMFINSKIDKMRKAVGGLDWIDFSLRRPTLTESASFNRQQIIGDQW